MCHFLQHFLGRIVLSISGQVEKKKRKLTQKQRKRAKKKGN
jgi:hypothetical protein